MNVAKNKNSRFIDSIFEILAGRTTEIYFNDLYDKAKEHMSRGSFISISEAYVHIIKQYTQAANNPQNTEFLRNLCRTYYNYYCTHTGKTNIDFSLFEDSVVSALMPEEHFNNLTPANKTKLLASCINHIITDFTISIIHKYKSLIIDNRKDPDIVRVLQDAVKELLYHKREDNFNMLAQETAASKRDDVSKLRAELREEVSKGIILKQENAKLTSLIGALTETIKKMRAAAATAQPALPAKCVTCDENRSKNVKLIEKTAELERENRSNSASLSSMRMQLMEAENKCAVLDAERARISRELDDAKAQLATMRSVQQAHAMYSVSAPPADAQHTSGGAVGMQHVSVAGAQQVSPSYSMGMQQAGAQHAASTPVDAIRGAEDALADIQSILDDVPQDSLDDLQAASHIEDSFM